jgi:hypothetical protein
MPWPELEQERLLKTYFVHWILGCRMPFAEKMP